MFLITGATGTVGGALTGLLGRARRRGAGDSATQNGPRFLRAWSHGPRTSTTPLALSRL